MVQHDVSDPVRAGGSRRAAGTRGEPLTRLLVVEDDPSQQRTLAAGFAARGYHVDLVGRGRDALDRAEALRPNLAILDLGLPDMDGLEVCRHLLLREVCPIIVVTADAIEDRMVEALDMGAADYVLKPFSLNVLDARVRRVLRARTTPADPTDGRTLTCGEVWVDVAGHELRVASSPVRVQPLQFSVLTVLMRNEGRVVTYAALARAVYGDDRSDRTTLESLRTCVGGLRKVLGSGPGRPKIVTEARVGYRLTAPGE